MNVEQIEKAFKYFWSCHYGHEYQPSDKTDNEVLRAFQAGAKAEREKVLREVESVCGKVIEAWDKTDDSLAGCAVQDVIDMIQKLKEAE